MDNKKQDLIEMIDSFKTLSSNQQAYIAAIIDFIPILKNQNSLLNQLIKDTQ